jgi:hypothetical protein
MFDPLCFLLLATDILEACCLGLVLWFFGCSEAAVQGVGVQRHDGPSSLPMESEYLVIVKT